MNDYGTDERTPRSFRLSLSKDSRECLLFLTFWYLVIGALVMTWNDSDIRWRYFFCWPWNAMVAVWHAFPKEW